MGVRPGVIVKVKEKHPFDGPLVVSVDGQDRTLSSHVANVVFVRKKEM
jgi:Fe2+ transport system protein FeoA